MYIAQDWKFNEIQLDAKRKSGHLFNVGKFISAGHVVLNALHELDDSFQKLHPNVSCRAVSDFWRSFQVHRHISQFCDRLAESKTARDYYGNLNAKEEVKNAMTYALRLLSAFVHEIGDVNLQSKAIDANLDQFRLPKGMQSGDPIDGNPFPEKTPEHDLWNDATKRAEEEFSLLNSKLLSERPTPALGNFADWTIRLMIGRFDIWAKRYVHVVLRRNAIPAYSQWLLNFAEVCIEQNRNTSQELVHVETFLGELRLTLMQRMEYWKTIAYRQVASFEKQSNQKTEGQISKQTQDGSELKLRTNKVIGDGSEVAQTELPKGRAAHWQDIQIIFLSDERVQIHIGNQSQTWNYSELGFADSRNGIPNQAWVILREMAKADGIIRNGAKPGTNWPKVEKRIQELRKALKNRFILDADPLPFVTGAGYKACFKISCGPSFNS